MSKSRYDKGREAELGLARSLRAKGASVKVSKASRGAADLRVKFSTGTKWDIQVKSSHKGIPMTVSRRDAGRLKQGAMRTNATPVVARVTKQGIQYISAKSGRKLTPPPRKNK